MATQRDKRNELPRSKLRSIYYLELTPGPSLEKRGEAPLCLIPTQRFSRGEFRWSTGREIFTPQKAARNSYD